MEGQTSTINKKLDFLGMYPWRSKNILINSRNFWKRAFDGEGIWAESWGPRISPWILDIYVLDSEYSFNIPIKSVIKSVHTWSTVKLSSTLFISEWFWSFFNSATNFTIYSHIGDPSRRKWYLLSTSTGEYTCYDACLFFMEIEFLN